MKSLYYQFVNFLQGIPGFWFGVIWAFFLCVSLLSIMKFYKIYNGEQKSFEKVSLLIISILAFAVMVFLTYIRH